MFVPCEYRSCTSMSAAPCLTSAACAARPWCVEVLWGMTIRMGPALPTVSRQLAISMWEIADFSRHFVVLVVYTLLASIDRVRANHHSFLLRRAAHLLARPHPRALVDQQYTHRAPFP